MQIPSPDLISEDKMKKEKMVKENKQDLRQPDDREIVPTVVDNKAGALLEKASDRASPSTRES